MASRQLLDALSVFKCRLGRLTAATGPQGVRRMAGRPRSPGGFAAIYGFRGAMQDMQTRMPQGCEGRGGCL